MKQYQFLYPGNEITEGSIVFPAVSEEDAVGQAEEFVCEDFPEVFVVRMFDNLENGVDRIIAHVRRGQETKVYHK